MSGKINDGKTLLENAYRLKTPDDNVAYYKEFSATYDDVFVKDLGFVLPQEVVRRFLHLATSRDSPVADLGCGTGIVGELLSARSTLIDGLDISQEMLDTAAKKSVYRDLFRIDLTKSVNGFEGTYRAILSSGTFTHGHLGPDAIDMALKLGAGESLFVLSINAVHFETMGFASKFDTLTAAGAIQQFTTCEVDIYQKRDHDHSGDKALIVSFRKTA